MRTIPDWWIQGAWRLSGIFATGAVWYFLSLKAYFLACLAASGAIAFAILAVSLHRKKDALNMGPGDASSEAINTFHSAFAEAVTQIGKTDAHSLMDRSEVQHDVAIHEFRRHVPAQSQAEFDAAAKKFQGCRDAVSPAALVAMRALSTGEAVDNSDIKRLAEALHELLAFGHP